MSRIYNYSTIQGYSKVFGFISMAKYYKTSPRYMERCERFLINYKDCDTKNMDSIILDKKENEDFLSQYDLYKVIIITKEGERVDMGIWIGDRALIKENFKKRAEGGKLSIRKTKRTY